MNFADCAFLLKMRLMNIQTEKLNLIEWITRLNDTSVITRLKEIKDQSDEFREKAERESVIRGLKDFEEGRTYPHDAARKIYEKYL